MKNNEYAATPNWFKDVLQSLETVQIQLNYYVSGTVASSGGLQSINLYNKFTINQYTLTIEDLVILDSAIIAASSKAEGTEEPTEEPDTLGNIVTDLNWQLSYSIRVIGNTTMTANLKSNNKEYGIVFYDRKNTPISGYIPTTDGLVEITVPEEAFYFRCCCCVEPESSEEYVFSIAYTSIDVYSEDLLNAAYSGVFNDFTITSQEVNEGIVKDSLSNTSLNLIFQQPLQYTVDNNNNIRVELNNEILRETLLSSDYVTTIADDPLDILSQKDFKEGLKINGIELVERNGFVLIKGNLATTGGITAYAEDPDDPGSGGEFPGGGTIGGIEIIGEGNALVNALLSEDKSVIQFERKWLVDLESDQDITGIKNFLNGLKISDVLVNVVDGVLYLDCSIAVTGGITAYALGSIEPSTIMDGIVTDNITIEVQEIDGLKKLVVIGGGGAGTWDELEGKPTWITQQKPTLSSFTNDAGFITSAALNNYATIEQLNTKWTQDDTKISNWDTAFSWGDHSKAGYAHLAGEETFTGLKHFTVGLTIGGGKHKFYEENGVVYFDGDLAVTGGITTYALAGRAVSTIMDAINCDNTTIRVNPTTNALEVIGGGGVSNWDDLEGIPSWITDTKPSYTWNEISGKPTWVTATKPSVSYWDNDAGYITNSALSDYATQSWVQEQGYLTDISADTVLTKLKTVDGSNSGLDADLLDGTHKSGLLTSVSSSFTTNLSITVGGTTKSLSTLYVDYATQLYNSRSIWGQSFNGTSDINGTLSGVSGITFTGSNAFNMDYYGNFKASTSSSSSYWNVKTYRGNPALTVNAVSGNVGIGTSSPTEKLHVSGNTRVTGYIDLGTTESSIKANGDIILRHTSVNNVVLSGTGKSIYFRPNGSTNDSGEAVLDNKGSLTLNGSLKVNGNILATGGITAYSSDGQVTSLLYDVSSFDSYTSTSTTQAPTVSAVKLIKDEVSSVSTIANTANANANTNLVRFNKIKSELTRLSSSSSASTIGAALKRIADAL